MSLRRFTAYFLALSVCAVALFPRLIPPAPPSRMSAIDFTIYSLDYTLRMRHVSHKKFAFHHKVPLADD